VRDIILLCYIVSFSLGLASLLFTAVGYIRYRSETLRYFFFSLIIVALYMGMVSVAFYQRTVRIAYDAVFLSLLPGYFLVISVCMILYSLFISAQHYFHIRLPRIKKALYSVLIFLIPQVVFSSSQLPRSVTQKPYMNILAFLTIAVVVSITAAFAVQLRRSRTKARGAVLRLLVAGTIAFIIASLFDLFLKMNERGTMLPYSAFGYAVLSLLNIAAAFYLNAKTASLSRQYMFDLFKSAAISNREIEIISLILQGYSNQKIADRLYISLSTVKSHVYSIYQKLGINSRAELFFITQGNSGLYRASESIL
jgi:DNA-binding CsgD family transcriptional regulator